MPPHEFIPATILERVNAVSRLRLNNRWPRFGGVEALN
jgi:hypothetical protein